jgi:hypothetical protein
MVAAINRLSDSQHNVGAPASPAPSSGRRAPHRHHPPRDAEAAEPDDPGEFLISRAGDTREELTVALAVGGTARPVADYVAVTTLGRIPAGAASVVVRLSPVNDLVREDDETVVCEILPSPSYNRSVLVADQQAAVVIRDDDGSGLLGVGFCFGLGGPRERAHRTRGSLDQCQSRSDNDVTVD